MGFNGSSAPWNLARLDPLILPAIASGMSSCRTMHGLRTNTWIVQVLSPTPHHTTPASSIKIELQPSTHKTCEPKNGLVFSFVFRFVGILGCSRPSYEVAWRRKTHTAVPSLPGTGSKRDLLDAGLDRNRSGSKWDPVRGPVRVTWNDPVPWTAQFVKRIHVIRESGRVDRSRVSRMTLGLWV